MSDIVLQDLDNGLLTITMNRPDRRNALNLDMTEGLVAAARRAQEDHDVRAVLIKGAGETIFALGVNYPLKVAAFDPGAPGCISPDADMIRSAPTSGGPPRPRRPCRS